MVANNRARARSTAQLFANQLVSRREAEAHR
jgi:hypothetical protein